MGLVRSTVEAVGLVSGSQRALVSEEATIGPGVLGRRPSEDTGGLVSR